MKKILSVILLFAVLLGTVACGGGSDAQTTAATTEPEQLDAKAFTQTVTQFSVGFDRQIMNPEESIPIDGWGNNDRRYCKEIIDDICTTAVAFADGQGNVAILINADLISAHDHLVSALKPVISAATGVPESMIVISGTHSHSAPALNNTAELAIENYLPLVSDKMIENAINAVLDLKPAAMYTGSIETERMNFTRHYILDDGSVVGDQFGDATGKTYVGHTFDADPTMHVVRLTREGGEDVVIVNFRAHPHFTGGQFIYDLSSDYVGPFRQAFEDQTGGHMLFLQGAAGNVNETSRIASENKTKDYKVYGALLAEYAMDCIENNMRQVEGGTIKVAQENFYGDINKSENHLFSHAKEVQAVWNTTADRAKAMEVAAPYGIRSPYHANAIVANYSRTKELDGRMELTAITVGEELAFVTFPGEAFDTISQNVEAGSPYAMTMFIGYANHHIGYLPNEFAYTYTSYETDITRFVRGTDALVENTYLNLLNGLKTAE